MTTAIPWNIDNLTIRHGKHDPPNGQVSTCAMEAAYLRWAARQGWPKKKIVGGWTDSLACVDTYIGAWVRNWNDGISDDDRGDAVRTLIFTPEVLDLLPETKGDEALMLRRMWMAIDWDIRMRTPAFLRLAKLEAQAIALESLPEILSQTHLTNARAACVDARQKGAAAGDAAGAAAGDAAGAAARAAAWAAARAAAGDAAGDAAGAAAWAAARAAAGDAAWAAAWAAARAAAGDAAWAAARAAAWAAARAAAGDAAVAAAWDAAGDAAVAAAWAAAWDAAGDAAVAAAWAAAVAAAWDAAGDAAVAAAWAAAGAAAWAAAGAAAWAAAWAALKPTVEAMQASAVELLRRMCAAR